MRDRNNNKIVKYFLTTFPHISPACGIVIHTMSFGFQSVESFKESSGYTIDGIWYPRVTKICEIKAKPALYRYYAELGSFDAGESIKEKSANEGTLIHETLQAFMIGKSPDIDPSVSAGVNAARKFIEDRHIHIDPDFIEKRVVHYGERYAGTMDALAMIDGVFGVLDIKTSASIYRDYCLQTSAYMDALKDQFSGIQTRWILRVDQNKVCLVCKSVNRPKGGREKIRKPSPTPRDWKSCADEEHVWSDMRGIIELKEFPFWQNDYQAFLGAKRLWEWENEYMLKKIGYLS